MSTNWKPDRYQQITPYLVLEDVAAEIAFAERCFGAEQIECMRDQNGTIQHAELRIGDSVVMLGSARDKQSPIPAMLYLYVPDCDAVYQKAIEAGAESLTAPADQFYGDRNGGVRTQNGVSWWIATHQRAVSQEELERHNRQ